MLKKLLSVILSVLIVVSVFSSFSAFATEDETEILGPGAEDKNLPEVAEGCNRYFFYMPKSWECEYSQEASIFWWEGTGCMTNWPGVKANKGDAEGLYYYDVPKDVTTIMWANNMDSTLSYPLPEYKGAKATCNIGTEFYYPGESELYPDGVESFHNMVYVIDIEECSNDAGRPAVVEYYGEWYYYYGNGEYGVTKEKGDTVYTQRHFGERDCYFDLPEVAEGCNRYFFYLPKSWENEFTQTAGIYWWEGTGAHDSWPGVEANKADAEGLYYYDVPKDVTSVFWNNFLDGGRNFDSPIYEAAQTSGNVCTEYYEAGESPLYPDGLESFNNMVYVINFDECNCNDLVYPHTFGGDWYFYYGNGEYGTTPEKGEVFYTERYRGNIYSHGKPSEPSTLPEVAEGYNRYFFYMPDEFYNESATEGPGIYWETEDSASDEFPGTPLIPTDVESLFYYDVPTSVEEFTWTNLFDGGEDIYNIVFYDELTASSIPYNADENFSLSDCNGMVFVVDLNYIAFEYETGKTIFRGLWFYYYGNGEYGTTPVRGDGEIYTEKVFNMISPQPPVFPYYVKLGDADGSGKVDIRDATTIQKVIADIQVKCYGLRADVDASGKMNVKDATAIQKYLAGIETGYPIGEIIEE